MIMLLMLLFFSAAGGGRAVKFNFWFSKNNNFISEIQTNDYGLSPIMAKLQPLRQTRVITYTLLQGGYIDF